MDIFTGLQCERKLRKAWTAKCSCSFQMLFWRVLPVLAVHCRNRNNHHNHCPCVRPAHVGYSWPVPDFQCSKQWKRMLQELQFCQHEIATGEIQEEEKSVSVESFSTSRLCWFQSFIPILSSSLWVAFIIHPLVHIDLLKRRVYD